MLMNSRLRLLLMFTFMLMFACTSSVHKPANTYVDEQTVSINNVKSHLHFLADDLLEGRGTGKRGHDIAALYVAGEFAKYGLKQGGDDNSYYQNIAFRESSPILTSPKLSFEGGKGSFSLSSPSQFVTFADIVSSDSIANGPLVFVGYGIVSPEYNIDDFADVDVQGKIVVMLPGAPKYLPSEEGAHLSSRTLKRKTATDRGAIGVLFVFTPDFAEVVTYQQVLSYRTSSTLTWLNDSGEPGNANLALKGSAMLSQEAAAQLFDYAPTSIDTIYQQLANDELPKGFNIPLVATLSSQSEHTTMVSPNVVGIVEGSDPILKHEYIVYTAHLDHTGIAHSVMQDRINNGAMDNAIGSSILLETARMFANMPVAPKRSIIFVALTGEEAGLLGSQFFARFPTVAKGSIVANVNLDMPILLYDFSSIIAYGAEHSSIKAAIESAAKSANVKMIPDPYPEQNNFTRSDHYSFVEQGIPSVYLDTGTTSFNPNENVDEIVGNFLANTYHKPSDDLSQNFNWKAMGRFTEINFKIGLILANDDNKPSWNEGNYFGEKFAQPQD